MAIKKRPPMDPAREAKIEAFAAAAEESTAKAVATPPDVPQEPVAAVNPPKDAAKKAKPKPMLLRLDAEQHELLKQVAEQQQRSMHNMALTVLIPALEALRSDQRA